MDVIYDASDFSGSHAVSVRRGGDDAPDARLDGFRDEWLSILRAPNAVVVQFRVSRRHADRISD